MSKLTGKPTPQPVAVDKNEMAARFKSKAPAAPKGIVDTVKDAAAKAFGKKKK